MADPIKHVVVLILENASFDRMLGAMPGVNGVDKNHLYSNRNYPDQTGWITQAVTTQRQMAFDPMHELNDSLIQMEGPCEGFVRDFAMHYPNSILSDRVEIMSYYQPPFLSVLHGLASAFTICDNWFSPMPGPTWPNRFFAHSGTSLGHTTMPAGIFHPDFHNYDQPTVYSRLSEVGVPWAIYYGDIPQSLVMSEQWKYPGSYHKMDRFFADAAGNAQNFPAYSFIEPTYFGAEQNDEHPPTDLMRGEKLIADVYNAIRTNEALWNETLLVVLYDEFGGLFDHVYPPAAVPPDGHTKEFAFNQYGCRVPALLISAWIDAKVISDEFDHTALLRYATDKWSLGALGARTARMNSFAKYISRTSPRTDTPAQIAVPQVVANPPQETLNTHQQALVGFSRYLETKIAAIAEQLGTTAAQVDAEVGERLLRSMQGIEQHAEVAEERVEKFLGQIRSMFA